MLLLRLAQLRTLSFSVSTFSIPDSIGRGGEEEEEEEELIIRSNRLIDYFYYWQNSFFIRVLIRIGFSDWISSGNKKRPGHEMWWYRSFSL